MAAQLADLHQQVLRAVADRRNQARQRALARRRQVARRALILGARVFGAPLAVLLYWLASTTHRDWRTASADAASSLTTLATAQVPLADARQLEAELQAEIARLEPFARESKDAAASVESTAGSELPGGSASIVQLQTLVAQQTAERARLQERHTELEQQFFQAAPARLGLQQA
ncbi:MAG: hypothetical protein H7A45_16500 [Verrucomicrobiales bacterium]|nr:hypothetical protein [Verrucomicrobiales bacterium]MCP5527900.1 hypothetical protein [Verrucomicrobiales bacterium]